MMHQVGDCTHGTTTYVCDPRTQGVAHRAPEDPGGHQGCTRMAYPSNPM